MFGKDGTAYHGVYVPSNRRAAVTSEMARQRCGELARQDGVVLDPRLKGVERGASVIGRMPANHPTLNAGDGKQPDHQTGGDPESHGR